MYRKYQVSVYYGKRDIDVQKIKVENAFFYTRLHHKSFFSICYYDIHIIVYGSLLSIRKCPMESDTTNS